MGEFDVVAEYRALRRSHLWPDSGAPDGAGRSVVLVGGFGVPDRTLKPLARWLAGAGWVVATADLGWNTACGTRSVDDLLHTLAARAEVHGPGAIVGHSRGGVLGRVAAVRAPELVASLVTVCTPWALGAPNRPGVAAVNTAIRAARRHGIDVLSSVDCVDGPCCADFRDQMALVPRCPWTLVRSRADGIAGAQALAPGATSEVVLTTSHLGGVLSVEGWTAIGAALASGGEERRH